MAADSGTYDEATMLRRRALLQALSSNQQKPIQHWMQGLAQLANTGVDSYELARLDAKDAADKRGDEEALAKMLGRPAPVASAASTPGAAQVASALGLAWPGQDAASSPAPPTAAPAQGVPPPQQSTSNPMGQARIPAGKEGFVESMMPLAMEVSKKTGLDPRMVVAQAALETGWGKSAPGNNYFGIKSHGQPGGNTLPTTEVVNGQPVRTQDSFRAYGSPAESAQGYADFVTQNPRYKPMLAAQGLDAQVAALGKSGYATDPAYGDKVLQIARALPPPGGGAQPAVQRGDPPSAVPIPNAIPGQVQATPAQGGGGILAGATPEQRQMIETGMSARPGSRARAIAEALTTQIMKTQAAQADPKYQLEIEGQRLSNAKAKKDLERSDEPTSVREYEYYRSNLPPDQKPMSYDVWATAKARAGAVQITNNVGNEPADGELRKNLDKNTAKVWSDYQQAGANSAGNMQDMQLLDELIKVAPQGPIQGRLAQALPGYSSAGDAFQSIVKRVAPTLRAPGSGATSDIEYDGMLKSLPALQNKPEANVAISRMMQAKSAINIERAEIISQYRQGTITAADAEKQIAAINKRSILTPDIRAMIGGLGGDQNKSSAPLAGDVQDGYRFKGGNPADQSSWEKVQ